MKLSLSKVSTLLCLTTSLLVTGCGDDDDGYVFSSGVNDDKPAATLSDNDKRTYCSRLDEHVNVTVGFQEISRILCLPAALLAGSRANCEQLLDRCSQNSGAPISVDVRRTNNEEVCYQSLTSCEASVSTLEGCVNVNVSAVRNVLETITCARFGDNAAAERARNVMNTAGSCASASKSCEAATTILL